MFNSIEEFLSDQGQNLISLMDQVSSDKSHQNFNAVKVKTSNYFLIQESSQKNPHCFDKTVFILDATGETISKNSSIRTLRALAILLKQLTNQPLVLSYQGLFTQPFKKILENDIETKQIAMAIYGGFLLVDQLLDGLYLEKGNETDLPYLFTILQSARQRISKPEYISCPSCGRTLFDLQEVTSQVKAATQHLVGVKIAVMGCIVNGPGEMADADFGYVGSGPGKITLYKGKKVMIRNVNSSEAVTRLIELIKEEGYWQEPEIETTLDTERP